MLIAEKHRINSKHPFYKELDKLAFLSKNLYNFANFTIRQHYIHTGKYLNYNALDKILQGQYDYKQLPAKVSQQVLKSLDKNWVSFFKSNKDWQANPSKYKGRPRLPRYKDKVKGRYLLVYTDQAISKPALKKGFIKLSKTDIKIKTQVKEVQQVRVVPRNNEYYIEVLYAKEVENYDLDPNSFISIDIGLNNLATITSNKEDFTPQIINGRVIKSFNQHFNKTKARLQSCLPEDSYNSKRITELTNKRNRKIDDYLHRASRYIIDMCLVAGLGKIIVGKNDGWKQDINIGKRNNQNFVNIPHARFIEMISYKAELVGIEVVLTEESYTSKCSFIDNESLSKKKAYLGKRVKRGLFKSSSGVKINADVNGSLNIARKVIPNFNINTIKNGIWGIVVSPIRINPYKLEI